MTGSQHHILGSQVHQFKPAQEFFLILINGMLVLLAVLNIMGKLQFFVGAKLYACFIDCATYSVKITNFLRC